MPPASAEPRAWRDPFVAVTALATAANLAIVGASPYVAAQDHLDHAASLRVLRGLWERDPFYVEHFRVVPRAVPDLLSELLWFAALRPLGELVASQLLVALYVAAMPLAWWLFLRRHCEASTAPLPLAPIAAMSLFYSLGSTNFLLGLPLFLTASALWEDVRRGRRALALFALAASVTWLSHVYDYVFLLIFVGAHTLAHALRGRLPARRELVGLAGLLAGFALAARAVLSHEGDWVASAPPAFDLRPGALVAHFDGALFLRGHGGTRYAFAALLVAPVAALAAALRDRALRASVRPVVALAALLTAAAMWVAPASLGGEGEIKSRFVVPCALLAMASVVAPAGRAYRVAALAALTAVAALKCNDERRVHARFARRAEAIARVVLPRLPRHARVLPASWWRARTVTDALFVHVADLAVITRDAYVSDLFDAPGQQVLRYRHRRGAAEVRSPAALTPAALAGYDYVWAQSDDPQALTANVRGCVEPVASTGQTTLYRIEARCSERTR